MKVYSILIPPLASGTIYRDKNNVWRHTQDPAYPAPHYLYTNNLWNSTTKQYDKINTDWSNWSDYSNLNSSEESCYVRSQDVHEYVENIVSIVEKNMENLDHEEEMPKYCILVVHSDLNKDPVYVAVVGVKGTAKHLWEKS